MTPQEFKFWFQGFTEGMKDAPDEDQWQRIKKRVDEIDGNPISYPVYIDKYVKQYTPWWNDRPYTTWCSSNVSGTNALDQKPFSSSEAMYEFGQQEFKGIK